MAKVRFEGVIVCDDVRREDNGKEILIGVYSGDITLPRLPANIRIFFWAMLYVEEGGEQTFNIRVLGPGEVQLIQGNFHALLPDTPPEGSLPIGPLLLQIQTAGQLSLQIKREGGEWETIKTKSVILHEENAA